jgi:aminobenzoyl-glutamate utilization protein B
LSQAASSDRQAVVENGPGHGCGHHLFGTASTAAAIAVKDWMTANKRGGTVKFFGTPAEEGGSGKVYMIRAGLFDDVDAVVAWHAGDRNAVSASSTLANVTAKVRFRGVSAHASSAPHRGRSALGTDTKVEIDITGSVWNVLPNEHLARVMHSHLETVGGFEYTPAERAFAEGIRKTLDGTLPAVDTTNQIMAPQGGVGTASTDMGDVSWRVPTVQMTAATWVPGTPAHSWQAVAAGGMSIGAKGMMVAAKTMALTVIDLMTDPTHLARARLEFDQSRGPEFTYRTRLADRKPALDYRKNP